MNHRDLAIACAESVAFLHFLHEVPNEPSDNEIPLSPPWRPDDYVLPFERERNLTGILAFLSCTNLDPNRIPALCIREDHQHERLEVIVAVNAKNAACGSQARTNVTQALRSILDAVSSSVESHSDSGIFSAIISACSMRILQRLRLVSKKKKKKKKNKPPIKQILHDASASLGHLGIEFRVRAKNVVVALDAWAGHQTDDRLASIVEQFHSLSRMENVQDLIRSIKHKTLHSKHWESLLNIVVKVARYREAARILYRMAKNYAIARKFSVIAISMTEDLFRRVPRPLPATTLASCLARMRGGHSDVAIQHAREKMRQMCSLLETNETEADAEFNKLRDEILKGSKIHAEVQLVHHCDVLSVHPRPRVICASKDACYLCNEYISSHGKYYTPKSHGKLYRLWCFQTLALPSMAMTRFVKKLEARIQASIELVIQRGERSTYPGTNESSLLTIPYSDSTQVISTASSSEIVIAQAAQVMVAESVSDKSTTDESATESDSVLSSSSFAKENSITTPEDQGMVAELVPNEPTPTRAATEPTTGSATESASDVTPSPSGNENPVTAQDDQVMIAEPVTDEPAPTKSATESASDATASASGKTWSSSVTEKPAEKLVAVMDEKPRTARGSPPRFPLVQGESIIRDLRPSQGAVIHCAMPLNLHLEYTVGSNASLGGTSDASIQYSLTWLTDAEADQARKAKCTKVIDGGMLKEHLKLDPENLKDLYILVKRFIFRFQLLEDPKKGQVRGSE